MSEHKAFFYGRVGNGSQLEAGQKAWLFLRQPTAQPDLLMLRWKQLRDRARAAGYQIVDETIVTGSDTLSMAAIRYIVENNDPENGADVIFSLDGNDLSRDLATAQQIHEVIVESGLAFRAADESHIMLDKKHPLGFALNAILAGLDELPDEGVEPDEDDQGIVLKM